MESRTCACAYLGLQMGCTSDHSAVNIVANTTDAGTFLPRVPPLYEERTSSWTPDIPVNRVRPQTNAEISLSCAPLRPSIQCALIWNIDRGTGTQHPTSFITGIHNEGFPLVSLSNSMCWTEVPCFRPSTAPETKSSPIDLAISCEGQTDFNLTDMNRNWLHEDVSMNTRLNYDHRYTGIHSTSNSSVPSILQGISDTSTVVQHQEENVSRDLPGRFQKTGIVLEKASSQSFRRSTCTGRASKGPYTCDICGKRYKQPQGVGRHYRARHDPNSCLYCDFEWSRPYQYRAHIKKKHPDVISDLALDDAKWTRNRVANTARCMRQHPLSEVVEVVEHGPQPESANLTIRMERKREDPPKSEPHTAFPSTEERSERATDLNVSSRRVQTWTRDEIHQDGCSTAHSLSAPGPRACLEPSREYHALTLQRSGTGVP